MIQQSHFWVYTQKNLKQDLRVIFIPLFFHSISHSSKEVEKMSINRWMAEENVMHVYNGILCNLKKEFYHMLQHEWTPRMLC